MHFHVGHVNNQSGLQAAALNHGETGSMVDHINSKSLSLGGLDIY